MKSDEQLVSNSVAATPTNLYGDWPPNLLRLVLGAMIGAVLGFIVLKTTYPIFEVSYEIRTFPEQSPAWLYERLDKAQYEVDGKNFAVVFGITGALLGASCAVLAFGARSIRAILIAVLGAAALGVLGAILSNWMFNNMRVNSGKDAVILGIALDGMKQSIVGYSLLWGLIGLGVGLGIGAIRGVGKSLVAGISGLCGGVLGAMVFVIVTAQISIGTTMNAVVPFSTTSQAIWFVVFPITISICIALGSGEKRQKATA
jgi:hypothetical protein